MVVIMVKGPDGAEEVEQSCCDKCVVFCCDKYPLCIIWIFICLIFSFGIIISEKYKTICINK